MENYWQSSPLDILHQFSWRGWCSRPGTDCMHYQKARGGMAKDSWLAFSQPQNISYEVFGKIITKNYLNLKQRKYFRSFSSFFPRITVAEISKQMFWNQFLFSITFFNFGFGVGGNFCVGSFACLFGFCWRASLPSAGKMVAFGTQKLLPSEIKM